MTPVFADNIVKDKQVVITQVNDDVHEEQKIEPIKPNTEIDETKLEQKEFTKSPYITDELRECIDRALKLNPTLKQRRAETEELQELPGADALSASRCQFVFRKERFRKNNVNASYPVNPVWPK